MPSLVTKINLKEHAIQYGHEVMSHCSRWKELIIFFSDGCLSTHPSLDSSSGGSEGDSQPAVFTRSV